MDNQPYIVVSTDSHLGPDPEVYREYCPAKLREEYEQYVEWSQLKKEHAPGADMFKPATDDELARKHAYDVGVNDPHERLKNMDADGIAAEAIFHGSGFHSEQRGFLPFTGRPVGEQTSWGQELEAVGRHMYNQWLSDFCAADPGRLLGVAEIPYWDVDASVKEVEWAASSNLACVNFPGPRTDVPTYNDPVWEPFWDAIEATNMSLNCHSGAAIHAFTGAGLAFRPLYWSEIHYNGRLPFAMLVFSGVFDRHPTLRVIFNEQRGYSWPQYLDELDAIHANPWSSMLADELEMKPSEYWRKHGFVGGSFLARFELEGRHRLGVDTITWGRDYPHVEGTWPHTREALRAAFYDIPEDEVRRMLGGSGIRCYDLDEKRMQEIADRIGPTPDEIAKPLEKTPDDAWGWAFRDRVDAKGGQRFGAY